MLQRCPRWLLATVLMLGAAGAAHARDLTYTGTLGAQAIVLELTVGDHGTVEAGRYFYARHHLDLMLKVQTATADHAVLDEGAGKTKPQLTLDRHADGSWRGHWRGAQGKTLPVTLTPAVLPTLAADAPNYLRELRTKHPYDYLRLVGLAPRTGKRETFMGHTLQWQVEPVSGMTLFTIVDGYPPDQLARINQVLVDRRWAEINSWFTCKDNHFGVGDYEQTVTPRLLTPQLVSISVFTNYYCGGAHPDFGDVPINLDARTAQPLTLEDLLWVGDGAPPEAMPDDARDTALSAYRNDQLAPWIVAQLQTLYPQAMQPTNPDNDCDYATPGVWQFLTWHLTPQGIFLGPSFARVARACEANDDWSLLPWRLVRQHPGRLGTHVLPGA